MSPTPAVVFRKARRRVSLFADAAILPDKVTVVASKGVRADASELGRLLNRNSAVLFLLGRKLDAGQAIRCRQGLRPPLVAKAGTRVRQIAGG